MEGWKWDGSFSKDFLSVDGFFNRGLTTAVFRSRGTVRVVRDDVRDGRQQDVMVFIKRGGNEIKFTRLGGCTVDYF